MLDFEITPPDGHLLTRYLLIAETIDSDDNQQTLHVQRSTLLPDWDALRLLRYAETTIR